MKNSCVVSALFITAAIAVAAPRIGHTSCNAIPDAAQVSGGTPQGSKIKASIPNDLAFRGAPGRIDRSIALPGVTEEVVIGPDVECGARPLRNIGDSGPINRDDVIGLVLLEPSESLDSYARVYASEDVCGRIVSAARERRERVHIIGRCNNDGVVVSRGEEDGAYRVKLPYPSVEELTVPARKGERVVSGPATVALFGASETGIGAFIGAVDRLVAGNCADIGADFGEKFDGYICVDDIYDDFASRCGVGPQYLAQVPCNFKSTVPTVDFKEQCVADAPAGTQLASCAKNPTEFSINVDSCGGVHVPFSWADIRTETGGAKIRRIVRGTTATSRNEAARGKQIFIPGREFLGSTHPKDPMGTIGSWRKPEITVWYPPLQTQDFGLIGSVDDDASIVHAYPRLDVDWLCDSLVAQDEACMGVEQSTSGGVQGCACQDRAGLSCTCKASINGPRYYACVGGDYEGMPCTRPRHCGVGSTCTGQPTCRGADEVWKKGKGTTHSSGTPCWTDQDCQQGNQDRCGYSLFYFGIDRVVSNEVLLQAEISGGALKKPRRGSCLGERSEACNNVSGGPKACKTAQGPCTGYTLEATGKR